MIEPLRILIDEHERIRSMLLCFEAQLDRLERAQRPDFEILQGSIAYCRDYLDRWHHPREDALFDLLQRRAPAEAKACTDLEAQHLGLARTTVELVRIFEAVERDAEYSRARLVERGQTLLHDYRGHLDWEEANFFPVVRKNLQPEDWRAIAPRFAESDDPLTGSPVDRRYRALLIAIAEL